MTCIAKNYFTRFYAVLKPLNLHCAPDRVESRFINFDFFPYALSYCPREFILRRVQQLQIEYSYYFESRIYVINGRSTNFISGVCRRQISYFMTGREHLQEELTAV